VFLCAANHMAVVSKDVWNAARLRSFTREWFPVQFSFW